jgi:F-type H+-transporting ATPase subunit a
MSAVKILALPFLLLASAVPAFAGEEAAPSLAKHLGGLPISNAILTSILVTVIVTIGIRWMVGKPKLVPSRGQSVFESLIITLRDMLEPIVGKKAMPGAFPVLLCLFIFILVHNWSGLFPFVGTAGWGHTDPETGKFLRGQRHARPVAFLVRRVDHPHFQIRRPEAHLARPLRQQSRQG